MNYRSVIGRLPIFLGHVSSSIHPQLSVHTAAPERKETEIGFENGAIRKCM